jgi:hypothetical protein
MASTDLSSASKYLNNLLLARGLLRDGKDIDFARPTHKGSTDATMSQVINLVHELVLRRDRDAEQKESLATVIRTSRNDEHQRLLDLQKSQEKNGELSRSLKSAEAQQRTLKAAVQRAETQAKDLKEQMLKMKSTVDQVRAKCISDVRKRDVELEKLKSHLSGMQRGKREASGIKINTINPQPSQSRDGNGTQDVNSTGWSLEKETNDFLAAIVNETSTENVALRGLLTSTMQTLRDLTGIDEQEDYRKEIGIPRQYQNSADSDSIIPCSILERQMRTILSHCQSILKDPSYVPIEEVQLREEEIIKLRIGWEKMAGRWKEAVTMMNGWRQKVLDGTEMDVGDLSDLSFGRSVAVLPNGEPVLGTIDEEQTILSATEPDLTGVVDERFDEDADLQLSVDPSPKRLASSPARRGIKLPQQPLQDASNRLPKVITPASSIDSLDGIIDENTRPITKTVSHPARQLSPGVPSPPQSIAEKLAAVEADAKAAREQQSEEIRRKRKRQPTRRDKARRRSTLSPEELAALMGGR